MKQLHIHQIRGNISIVALCFRSHDKLNLIFTLVRGLPIPEGRLFFFLLLNAPLSSCQLFFYQLFGAGQVEYNEFIVRFLLKRAGCRNNELKDDLS